VQEIDTLLEELCVKEEEVKNKPSVGDKSKMLERKQKLRK